MRVATVARKKTDLKLSVVKIESTLARKAKAIAADRGIPLSTYLSQAITAAVDRDWPRILRKLAGPEGGER